MTKKSSALVESFNYSRFGEKESLRIPQKYGRGHCCHARESVCVVGYSLFVLLSEPLLLVSVLTLADELFSEAFDGFLVFPGFAVDDLARLSVT